MAIGAGVSLRTIYKEDSTFTFNVSGTVATTDEGKALALDATGENTLKLAGAGDMIIGQLFKYEDRGAQKLVTAACDGVFAFPIASGLAGQAVVAVGKYLEGSANGNVRAIDLSGAMATAAAAPKLNWLVIELVTLNGVDYAVAMKV